MASRARRGSTAFAADQSAGQFQADIFMVMAVFAVEEESESEMPHFLFGNVDRCQHRHGFLRIIYIIYGNNRGKIPSFFVPFQRVQNAEGCAVIGAEDGGRTAGGVEQGGHRMETLFLCLVSRVYVFII